MKKAALAFGLVLMTSVSVLAQEAAVEAVADAAAPAVEAAAPAPVQETVLDGQVIEGQDMTYTSAPAVTLDAPVADCGCGTPAPVAVAAPVADCGCGAPAPAPVADCGCAPAPAPAPCCEPAPEPCCAPAAEPCCEPAPAPCCCKRERRKVVRTWISNRRARRCCCR